MTPYFFHLPWILCDFPPENPLALGATRAHTQANDCINRMYKVQCKNLHRLEFLRWIFMQNPVFYQTFLFFESKSAQQVEGEKSKPQGTLMITSIPLLSLVSPLIVIILYSSNSTLSIHFLSKIQQNVLCASAW